LLALLVLYHTPPPETNSRLHYMYYSYYQNCNFMFFYREEERIEWGRVKV